MNKEQMKVADCPAQIDGKPNVVRALLNKIKLEPVYGSDYCKYSIIEQKLEILYKNQEKILQAIKLIERCF